MLFLIFIILIIFLILFIMGADLRRSDKNIEIASDQEQMMILSENRKEQLEKPQKSHIYIYKEAFRHYI